MLWLTNLVSHPKAKAHGREVLLCVAMLLLFGAGVTVAATPEAAVPPDAASPVIIQLSPLLHRAPPIPDRISQASAAEDALKNLMAEHRCLAEVMYYEANGEGEAGEEAIAEVIFNRLAAGGHGHTICGVVYEGAGQTFCQFTFACDGSLSRPKLSEPWRAAQVLAARLLAGELPTRDATGGATSFHSIAVHPSWAGKMVRVAQIGSHIFYRAPLSRSPIVYAVFRGALQ